MIAVRGVTFSYARAAEPAARDLHFEIGRGEVFGFLGPNGAGKSTTQRILIRLLRDYEGSVTVLGRDLAAWGDDYHERIGVSFEIPNHYLKLTATENLRYFAALYSVPTREPRQLLDLVGLSDEPGTPVSRFSRGMKVRLGIARALLNDPEIVFLDEPTGGLDPVGARIVKGLIREQRDAGRTVFLTTHDMSVADELCDRVAFLVDGRIAAIDAPRELRLRHGERTVRVELGGDGPSEAREFPLEGLGDSGEFLELLRRGEIETIHTLEATLEDVFVQVTGRTLR